MYVCITVLSLYSQQFYSNTIAIKNYAHITAQPIILKYYIIKTRFLNCFLNTHIIGIMLKGVFEQPACVN